MTKTTVARLTENMFVSFDPDGKPKRLTFYTRITPGKYYVRLAGWPRAYPYGGAKRVWVQTEADLAKAELVDEATRYAAKNEVATG